MLFLWCEVPLLLRLLEEGASHQSNPTKAMKQTNLQQGRRRSPEHTSQVAPRDRLKHFQEKTDERHTEGAHDGAPCHSSYATQSPRRGGCPFLKKVVRRVSNALRDGNEFWGIPVALVAFTTLPYLLRWLDSTTGAYDLSVLQSLLLGVLAFWFIKGVAWWLLKMDFPEVYHWLDDQLEGVFRRKAIAGSEDESRAQGVRVRVSLTLYIIYLTLSVVLVAAAL